MIVWLFIISLFSFVYLFLRIFRLHKFKYKQCVRAHLFWVSGLQITIKTNAFGDSESVFVVESSWIILTICESLRTLFIFFSQTLFCLLFCSECVQYIQWKFWWVLGWSVFFLNWMGKRIILMICVEFENSELGLNLIA